MMLENNNHVVSCAIGLDPIKMGVMFRQIDEMHENIKEIKQKVNEQNGRVKKLELWRAYLLGGVFVVSTIVGIVIKILF